MESSKKQLATYSEALHVREGQSAYVTIETHPMLMRDCFARTTKVLSIDADGLGFETNNTLYRKVVK